MCNSRKLLPNKNPFFYIALPLLLGDGPPSPPSPPHLPLPAEVLRGLGRVLEDGRGLSLGLGLGLGLWRGEVARGLAAPARPRSVSGRRRS